MRIHIKKTIRDYVFANRWKFALLIFFLFLGALTGPVALVSLEDGAKDATEKYLSNLISAYNLHSVGRSAVFKRALYTNIKSVLFFSTALLWIGFVPFLVFVTAIKGYKVGFTASLCVKVFGIKGAWFSCLALIPQIAIFIPALLIYGVYSINFALLKRRKILQRTDFKKNEIYIKCFLVIFVMIIISIVSAFADAYIIPPILKPLCSGFVW